MIRIAVADNGKRYLVKCRCVEEWGMGINKQCVAPKAIEFPPCPECGFFPWTTPRNASIERVEEIEGCYIRGEV